MSAVGEPRTPEPVTRHIWKGNGWRHHVISWHLMSDGKTRRTCSEPNCEVNQ